MRGRPPERPAPSEEGHRPSPSTRVRRTLRDPAPTVPAPASVSSDRIAKAEALASKGVQEAWRRADRFAADARNADRVASLIRADKSVFVEDGFIISRATGERLAAIGAEVQAAIGRGARGTKARG